MTSSHLPTPPRPHKSDGKGPYPEDLPWDDDIGDPPTEDSKSERTIKEPPTGPDNVTKEQIKEAVKKVKEKSDGSSAGYYDFPEGASVLQDLISYRNMNAQIGEVFRMCYIFGNTELDVMAPMQLPLPDDAVMLQDLISFLNLNAQLGEVFRACFRMGHVEHSEEMRDAKKIKFYLDAEQDRILKYDNENNDAIGHIGAMISRIDAEIARLEKF